MHHPESSTNYKNNNQQKTARQDCRNDGEKTSPKHNKLNQITSNINTASTPQVTKRGEKIIITESDQKTISNYYKWLKD